MISPQTFEDVLKTPVVGVLPYKIQLGYFEQIHTLSELNLKDLVERVNVLAYNLINEQCYNLNKRNIITSAIKGVKYFFKQSV